ncbi:MAG: MauE/DoxX family redox-associated membrane protein [Acidimicrobiales bacterium]
MAFLGPFWVAALVLAAAGIGKLRYPHATADAMKALGLPHRVDLARLLGGAELALAGSVFVVGGPLPGLLTAAAYLAFAATAARLVTLATAPSAGGRAAKVVGCGCFGQRATPIGPAHIFANLALASASLTAVLTSTTPSLASVAPDLPALGLAHLLLIGTATAATVAMLTVLPEVKAARVPVPATDPRVHLFGATIARKPSRPGTGTVASAHEADPYGLRS